MNVMLLFLSFFNFLFIVIEAYNHQPGYNNRYRTPSPPATQADYRPPASPQPGFSDPSPQSQVERERSRSPTPSQRQVTRRRESVPRTATTAATNTRTATTTATNTRTATTTATNTRTATTTATNTRTARTNTRTARTTSVVMPGTTVELFKILDSDRDRIVTRDNYQTIKDGTIYNVLQVRRVLDHAFSEGNTIREDDFPKCVVDLKSLNSGMGYNRGVLKSVFGFTDDQVTKMLNANAFTPAELADFFNKKTTLFFDE